MATTKSKLDETALVGELLRRAGAKVIAPGRVAVELRSLTWAATVTVEVRAILDPAEQDRLKGVALGYLREHSYLARRCGVRVNQGRRGMRAYEHQCDRKIVGVVFRRLRFTPEPAPLFCCAQHIKAEACAPDVLGAVLLPASEIEAVRRRYETIDLPAWLAAEDERDNQRRRE